MNKVEFKSYAKINLALEIGKKLPDNYHEIRSIMQQVNMFDGLSFKKINENKIIIKCSRKELENNENICYKSALLLKDRFNIKEGVEVNIEKNIPIGSGLAGGSGNAAVTLKAINEMFDLNLSEDELTEIGTEIGSDVPFQLIGGTALVEDTGERITKLNSIKDVHILLINPNIEISTKWAYEEFDMSEITTRKLHTLDGSKGAISEHAQKPKVFDKINNQKENNHFEKMLNGIENNNLIEISENLYNDFEELIFEKYPEIKKIKEDLIKNNALNALMSGSGSSVFGLFEDEENIKKAFENLKDEYKNVFLLKTV